MNIIILLSVSFPLLLLLIELYHFLGPLLSLLHFNRSHYMVSPFYILNYLIVRGFLALKKPSILSPHYSPCSSSITIFHGHDDDDDADEDIN